MCQVVPGIRVSRKGGDARFKKWSMDRGTPLAVQWLGLRVSTARGVGSIPGWGTKIPHATPLQAKKKVVHGQRR